MPTVLVACALGVFAYASGNAVFSTYLQIPQIPGAGELVIICAAIAGAGLGFLWFNTYPAMVFMGDIGALALGAVLGTIAVIRSEEHTSELQSLMRISYAVFCLQKKKT